jgi:hypothetical protein
MPPVREPLAIGVDDAPVSPPLELAPLPHAVQGIRVNAQLGRQGGGGYPWFGFGFGFGGGGFLLDHHGEKFDKFFERFLDVTA